MRRTVLIATLCGAAILGVYWFGNKYFAVELQSVVSRLFPPPSVQQVEAKQLRRTAGWFSRDCGLVRLHDDPTKVMSCANDAMREHHSFRVAFEWVGVDSHGQIGLAGNSGGDIYEITTDEMSAGGGIFNVPPYRVTTIHKCEKPVSEIAFGPRGTRVLSCTDVGTIKYDE